MEPDWGRAAAAYVDATDDRVAILELVDGRLVIRAVNPALAAFLGREPADLADQPAERVYPADEVRDVTAKVRTTLAAGEPLVYEAVRELPQGRVVMVGRLLPLDDGRVLGIGTDVSRQRDAEEQLAALEALGDIGLWSWNVVDDELVWSAHFRRLHGLTDAAPASIPAALDLVHPDDRPAVAAVTDELGTEGRGRTIRYRVVRADGAVRHVEGRSQVVHDAAGRVIRVYGTVQDVTERSELEERDRRLREAARRQAQAMELNDDIVQELSRAWLALELDDTVTARRVIEDTTRRVQDIVRGLLQAAVPADAEVGPGDLVRERPAGGEDAP